MPLLDNELAHRAGGTGEGVATLELRPTPLRLRWRLTDLATSDGHRLDGAFSCSVRALPESTEQRMLAETFLQDRFSVMAEDVVAHFLPAFTAAARNLAANRSVSDWLTDTAKPAMIDALRDAGKRVAFACGLELLPPFHLDLESPSFQQQKLEALQRDLAEKRAAGQAEHVQRALQLLQQFQSMNTTAELSPGKILERLSPADQGGVLHSLLLASAEQGTQPDLWLVAGPYLVRARIDAKQAQAELIPLPPTLGPLRSVQPAIVEGQRRLLVGAQSGVMLVDPQAPQEPILYADGGVDSTLGFSRALVHAKRIYACHGEAGIVAWQLADLSAPALTVRADRLPDVSASTTSPTSRAGPRNLQALNDSHLIFSLASRLVKIDTSGEFVLLPPEDDTEIVAILPTDAGPTIVHAGGQVCQYNRDATEVATRQRRTGRLSAAATLPWLAGQRLLLASEDGPVYCTGLDDSLVTQYLSPYRALRAIAASHRHVAALSSDRQRLVLWNSWDGKQPICELYLTGIAKHRAADVDFG